MRAAMVWQPALEVTLRFAMTSRFSAKLLAGGREDVGEFAREAAEAHLDLTRIRKIRARLYERMRFLGAASMTGEDRREFALKFARLERYERRAFSKRKRALRLM